MTIEQISTLRDKLQKSCDLLIKKIGPIQIGTIGQFPYGWGKSAKGRTVWRIVEEVIIQNLRKHHLEFGIDKIETSGSEISVYDMKCTFGNDDIYINIKSAVEGGKRQKDDISKAVGLQAFYNEDSERNFFVGTFCIQFNQDMTIEITRVIIFPIVWIKDIYVNPSNNGNLQSAYYKDLSEAKKRTNAEFLPLFQEACAEALRKKKLSNK